MISLGSVGSWIRSRTGALVRSSVGWIKRQPRWRVALAAGSIAVGALLGRGCQVAKSVGKASPQSVERRLRGLGEVGLWLWQSERCPCACGRRHRLSWSAAEQERHYADLAAQAVKAKIGFVLLKVHDGTKPFRTDGEINRAIAAFNRRRVKVLVWGFNYCRTPEAEADLVAGYLDRPGVIGYVANTEAPVVGRPTGARRFFFRLRWHQLHCRHCRGKLVGYAPYAYPSRHAALPYAVCNEFADFVMPQMYWGTMGRPVKTVVAKTYADWSAWELRQARLGRSRPIPILPLGQSYGRIRPSQISQFIRLTSGYYAVSFWDWQHAQPWMWRELAAGRSWRLSHRPKGRLALYTVAAAGR